MQFERGHATVQNTLARLLLALLCLGVLTAGGCGQSDSDAAAGTGGGHLDSQTANDDLTRGSPYQTIPPPLHPYDSGAATTLGPLHWQPAAATPCVFVDCRSADVCVTERLAGSRRIITDGWPGSLEDYRASNAMTQVRRLVPADSTLPIVLIGENDYACAKAWVMLQVNGQRAPLICWGGMAAAKAANLPVIQNTPELLDNLEQIVAYGETEPTNPAWLIDAATFNDLAVGLWPVSQADNDPENVPVAPGLSHPALPHVSLESLLEPAKAEPVHEIPPLRVPMPPPPPPPPPPKSPVPSTSPTPGTPATPATAGTAGTPTTPGTPPAATNPSKPVTPKPTPTTAPKTHKAPVRPPPLVVRFVFCGSAQDWKTEGDADNLLRNMVRIPPNELYGENTLMLLRPEVIRARVRVIHMDPNGTYTLTGDDSTAVCAVYMALISAGFQHVQIFFR